MLSSFFFLAETTGLASAAQCQTALTRLAGLSSIEALLADIAPKAQGSAGRG